MTLPTKPVTDFSVEVTAGVYPILGVAEFTDLTTADPTQWFRDFGDGHTSLEQNPVHNYYKPGDYTVKLLTVNALGEDEEIKVDEVTIAETEVDGLENTKNIDEARRGEKSVPPVEAEKDPTLDDLEKTSEFGRDGDRTDHVDVYA